MNKFDIEFMNDSGVEVDTERLLDTARFVMAQLRLHDETELSIAFVDLEEMERLHIEHMDEHGATDVLSFPMDDLTAPLDGVEAEAGLLGDVVLCPQFAATQAAEVGHAVEVELDLLLTHGILHLLGHDHQEPEEHAVMFGIQGHLLEALTESRGQAS